MKEKGQFKSILPSLYSTEHGGTQRKVSVGRRRGSDWVGKASLHRRQSFLRCSGPSVVEVCADTIKSPISRIFYGKFCMTSQDDAVNVESWRRFQLDIQPSDPIKASQGVTVLIEALPPVLIVHLNRFHYDTVAGGVVKNASMSSFPRSSKSHQPDDPWCRRDTHSMECSTT
ncbi:hypothetical protein BGY98DRAFT_1176405, partial [Russula aff. rugulosa BPL654]